MSDEKGIFEEAREVLWDPIAGFGVTFRTMFRKPVTEQYPFEKVPTAPRFHGRHQLNRWPDGLEKCIGCELCAWACPADAIYVEGASNVEGGRYSPGERYGRVYQINYLRCILCGLCIEACPTRALTMTNEYELADNNRADLIYEKDDLLAPLLPGMVEAPHEMLISDDHHDYYRGKSLPIFPVDIVNRGRRQSDNVLAPRADHGDRGPRAGVRQEGRSRGAVPGDRDDQPRGPVRRAGRTVPVRRADHRLHRRDHDAVPVRPDAGRRRVIRRGQGDDQGPALPRRGDRPDLRHHRGARDRPDHHRRRGRPQGRQRQRQPVRSRRAAVRQVRPRLRVHQRTADHRRTRRHGAGSQRAPHAAPDAGRHRRAPHARVRRDRPPPRTAAGARRVRPPQRGRHPGAAARRHPAGVVDLLEPGRPRTGRRGQRPTTSKKILEQLEEGDK